MIDKILEALWQPQVIAYIALLAAVVFEAYFPWPDKYHPLTLIKLSLVRVTQKVLPKATDSPRQHKISGALACCLIVCLVGLTASIVVYWSQFPVFFEFVLLVIALRLQDTRDTCSKVATHLKHNKKILARQTLALQVLRETQALSPVGLIKASGETLILKFTYQFSGVVFWFVLTGGVGALLYRVIYECAKHWHYQNPKLGTFGWFAAHLSQILQWPATVLTGLTFALSSVSSQALLACLSKQSFSQPRAYLLHIGGRALGIELGGPAFYFGKKIRNIKCSAERQVVFTDLARIQMLLSLTKLSWLTLLFLFTALSVK